VSISINEYERKYLATLSLRATEGSAAISS
jgi:hypothetical protein